jgi:hypothetical protein
MASNAARTTKSYDLTRAALIDVSGGWLFNINIPSETAPQSPAEPATAAIDGAHVGETPTSELAVPADEAIELAGRDLHGRQRRIAARDG